jgi:hypothetical protein
MAVYCENHMKHKHWLGKMKSSFNVKAGVMYCYHRVLKELPETLEILVFNFTGNI